mmetsp:Transcript_18642/g.44148  ORF Transcript_18642/g.44148 Transcript_18642/m.44148 type:complete len:497 (-) Transcript_18642:65-1555(-)
MCSVFHPMATWLLWTLLPLLCCGDLLDDVEGIEESEMSAMEMQLLQQKVRRRQSVVEVPSSEQFNLNMARAFGSLSQAAFCGADEALRNWTCEACAALGFQLAPGTQRLVRQAELGEMDSTFIFASRVQWTAGGLKAAEAARPWPAARRKEAVKNAAQDCYGHCGGRGGFCAWCGVGNACCRQGEAGDPAECFTATGFNSSDHHECVPVKDVVPRAPLLHEKEDCWIYCGKAGGFCDWCGAGNACCRSGFDTDPLECKTAKNVSAERHSCALVEATVPPPSKADFGCALSIRGSKTFTNALHDAFFWSDALPHEECDGCQVFDGFWRVWTGIEAKVWRVLVDNGCLPGTDQGTILITGHSLGAAVGTLAMYMLQLRGYSVGLSYNFESPRVGNDVFKDAFASLFQRSVAMYRITRARDPVVHVPPLPIYHHVGSEAYFPGGRVDDVTVCIDPEDSNCANRYSLIETIFDGMDHCKSELVPEGRGFGFGICQCVAAG